MFAELSQGFLPFVKSLGYPLMSFFSIFILFSIIVLVHEFGHFWVAKKVGINVERFSLGFGPKIISWKRGGTTYQICLLLFGGFVKMAGDEYEQNGPFKAGDYMGKPPGLRAEVVVSGGLHNLLLGFILLIPVFMAGVPGYDGTKIGSFIEGMPAETSGLEVGDEILEVNGKPCREWFGVSRNIKKASSEHNNMPIRIKVRRTKTTFVFRVNSGDKVVNERTKSDSRILTFDIMPREHEAMGLSGKKEMAYIVGIYPQDRIEKYSLFPAIVRAAKEVKKMIYGVFLAFRLLLTRQVSAKMLSGPVGIAQWGAEIAHLGFFRFLYFLCFISVNLGVINLFPLPILDGGHLVGLFIEKVSRKRPSKKLLEIVQYVGAVALIVLALYVTYNDILRIITEKLQK